MELDDRNMLKQGAEAKLFKCKFYGKPCIVKERFKKTYRHPILDTSLTTERIKSEVRAMLRCRMNGIKTPSVYFLDLNKNSIYMQEIENSITVKDYIVNIQRDNSDPGQVAAILEPLGRKIGEILGIMHRNSIIHGDLTTSNMLLKDEPSDLDLYMIDFGLSHFENLPEDKGVDLYVLERALLSSHPNTEQLFDVILESYKASNTAQQKEVIAKLDEVRLRGRKRTMVG